MRLCTWCRMLDTRHALVHHHEDFPSGYEAAFALPAPVRRSVYTGRSPRATPADRMRGRFWQAARAPNDGSTDRQIIPAHATWQNLSGYVHNTEDTAGRTPRVP